MDYDLKNMCVWYDIFICPDVETSYDFGKCDGCKMYISVSSPEGKAVSEKYFKDIQEVTNPVRKKWRKVMDSERMIREGVERKDNHAQ